MPNDQPTSQMFGSSWNSSYAVFLGVRNAAGILVLVVIALFLAVGLHPAVVRLRRWGLPHGLAVAVVTLTVVLLIVGGLLALVPPVVTQSGQFVQQLPGVCRGAAPQPRSETFETRLRARARGPALVIRAPAPPPADTRDPPDQEGVACLAGASRSPTVSSRIGGVIGAQHRVRG